jgi:hypothetical protein
MANALNYKNLESLQPVVNVINEANLAINIKDRVISDSPISEVLVGALGASAGGAVSFSALYLAGTAGLSAAGITSGLATAGALVGGGMAAGVFVLAAPIAILASLGVLLASKRKRDQLNKEKRRLLQAAIEKQQSIIKELQREVKETRARADYLQSLNILLQKVIRELKADLQSA